MLYVYWFLWPIRLVWLLVCCPQSLFNRTFLWRCLCCNLKLCPFDVSVGVRAFVTGLGQISSVLFLYLYIKNTATHYNRLIQHFVLLEIPCIFKIEMKQYLCVNILNSIFISIRDLGGGGGGARISPWKFCEICPRIVHSGRFLRYC